MEPVVRGRPTSLCLCARTLLLLPSVECQHPPKLSVPAGLLPTVGPLLSIAEGDSFPADALISIRPSVQGHQARAAVWRPFSPVIATDFKHGACAMLPPPAHAAAIFCNCRAPQREPGDGDLLSSPPTLQFFPAISKRSQI
ncbi:hypothetical protein ZWY2020_043889 [Hordeum vulgare]|nr:hypothetical protein ZWY2020_043889 [Hordeum vulgare]